MEPEVKSTTTSHSEWSQKSTSSLCNSVEHIPLARAGKSRGTGEPRFPENFGKSANLTENVKKMLDISWKILWNLGHLTENFSIFVKNFMLLFDFIFNIYW